mmetsp:Transcript_10424/g.29312  ORF Transcript_10424/g.29312 Transcript_10424/m.29312 type:complete len:228 (-) Transcript_10424:789-1472(-)
MFLVVLHGIALNFTDWLWQERLHMQYNPSKALDDAISRKLDSYMKVAIGEIVVDALVPPNFGNSLGLVAGEQIVRKVHHAPIRWSLVGHHPHGLGCERFRLSLVRYEHVGVLPKVVRKSPPVGQPPRDVVQHGERQVGRDRGVDVAHLPPQEGAAVVAVRVGTGVDDDDVVPFEPRRAGRHDGLLDEPDRRIVVVPAARTEEEEDGGRFGIAGVPWRRARSGVELCW